MLRTKLKRTCVMAGRVASRSVFMVLAVAVTAALFAAGFAVRSFLEERAAVGNGVNGESLARGLTELEQRVADLAARIDAIERPAASSPVRAEELADRRDGTRAAP